MNAIFYHARLEQHCCIAQHRPASVDLVSETESCILDRFIVAIMALVGITTALLVNMLGQARIWTMAAREHMIPGFWAKVSPRFGTPIAAQITMGSASGETPLKLLLSCPSHTSWKLVECSLLPLVRDLPRQEYPKADACLKVANIWQHRFLHLLGTCLKAIKCH